MTLAQLVMLALQTSIALIVIAIALRAAPGDLTSLFRRPSLLVRSLLAMNVVMPVVAVGIAVLFHLPPRLEAALMLLAVSPVPPLLPGKQGKAGGSVSYAVGLLAVSALVAIVTVPASVTLIGRLFGRELHVPATLIATVVLKTVLAPLLVGSLLRRATPSLSARLERPITHAASVVLGLGVVLILIRMWPAVVQVAAAPTLLAIALFVLAGLAVGHLLGGPAPEDRTVLALSTSTRHPGVAITVAGAIAADRAALAPVAATVVLCLLVAAIVTAPYVKMRRRGSTSSDAPAGVAAG